MSGESISNHSGVLKWYINPEKCYKFWVKNWLDDLLGYGKPHHAKDYWEISQHRSSTNTHAQWAKGGVEKIN